MHQECEKGGSAGGTGAGVVWKGGGSGMRKRSMGGMGWNGFVDDARRRAASFGCTQAASRESIELSWPQQHQPVSQPGPALTKRVYARLCRLKRGSSATSQKGHPYPGPPMGLAGTRRLDKRPTYSYPYRGFYFLS